ncbi:hypothetical protein CGLO_09505 [Colletotrichum gloeosporioides Cg-14]|uniref:Uncharacterized protein n=1 Tax=Colletotrichum gloeosporioides (strain Cg-14) TaxID=1237896 RepID=T0KDR2_COLGC|nr:hypothetical protein CGLO_09505 [Colletotrichum gloeosporioides Cg-14]
MGLAPSRKSTAQHETMDSV